MKKRVINSLDGPAPAAYPHAVEVTGATRLLAIPGQVPVAPDGTLPDGFAEQAGQTWRNVEAQLRAAKVTWDNLWRTTIYLSDRAYRDENRVIRQEMTGNADTALVVIIADIFDKDWLLEIDVMAAA